MVVFPMIAEEDGAGQWFANYLKMMQMWGRICEIERCEMMSVYCELQGSLSLSLSLSRTSNASGGKERRMFDKPIPYFSLLFLFSLSLSRPLWYSRKVPQIHWICWHTNRSSD
jgi:hypothetical protein